MSSRVSSHKIETMTKDNVRKIINSGDFLFREITERDYGIDAIIEYFDSETITGKVAFIQLKGTKDKIKLLKDGERVSCSISSSSARYGIQKNIPVVLIYSSLEEPSKFYYFCLQDEKFEDEKLINQKTITVHIPIKNVIDENTNALKALIDKFYN